MVSFREQMQQLVDNIASSRRERHAFVARNHKDCERMRADVSKQREATKRDLAKQASGLSASLVNFNRSNQKSVARTLRDNRQTRLNQASVFRSSLSQDIAKNRRNIARMLRQNQSDRKRTQRQQVREAATTLNSVRSQVQRIRTATRRMTRSLASDRSEAKQIWARLRHGKATVSVSSAPAMISSFPSIPAPLPLPPTTIMPLG